MYTDVDDQLSRVTLAFEGNLEYFGSITPLMKLIYYVPSERPPKFSQTNPCQSSTQSFVPGARAGSSPGVSSAAQAHRLLPFLVSLLCRRLWSHVPYRRGVADGPHCVSEAFGTVEWLT